MLALLLFVPVTQAFDVGHSRVSSSPGQALVVEVPLRNVNTADGETLDVTLPDTATWQASGLKPPVALESLQVSILPGNDPSSRLLRLSSPEASLETVINVLLNVSTGSANRVIQSSVIVLPPPSVTLPSGQSVTVARGDTLIGIANQFPVSGANLYQRLWALFEANPDAFMSENMNLLKSGAALNIPDADSVRAVDPAFAKARYLAHVQAFQRMRGGGSAVPATSADAKATPTPADQNRGQVQEATTPAAPSEQDQVRLSSAPADAVADQQTSQARAVAEEQARTDALESNVEALQSAISDAEANAQSGNGAGTAQASSAEVANKDADSNQANDTNLNNDASSAGTSAAGTGSAVDAAGDTGSSATDSASSGSTTSESAATNSTVSPNSTTSGAAPIDGAPVESSAGGEGVGAVQGADAISGGSAGIESTAGSDSGAGAAAGSGANGNAVVTGSDAPIGAATSTESSEPAKDAVTRAMDWVSNNVAASIAIVLALFALILAWALRATSRNEMASSTTGVTPEMAFKEKLESIDLSLDEEPSDTLSDSGAPKEADKAAQSPTNKTDTKSPPKNDGSA